MRKVEQRLEDVSFKDARTRIKDFLFDFANEHGRDRGPRFRICSFLSHQDIARLTVASRQTVTSVLNQLKREGLVDYNRRSLVVKLPA